MDPDWASVTHGTLVCLKCAGRHRTLGVHVSRIKSLTMDAWEPTHVTAMLLSGNMQVKGFFRRQKVHNTAIEQLYTSTRAAEFYRTELAKQVEIELAKFDRGEGCVLDEVPLPPASPTNQDNTRKSLERGLDAAAAGPPGASSSSAAAGTGGAGAGKVSDEHYEAIIAEQSLGLTLHREMTPFGNFSKVTRVKAGGAAEAAGVVAGDFVVGAAGRMAQDYDKVGRSTNQPTVGGVDGRKRERVGMEGERRGGAAM